MWILRNLSNLYFGVFKRIPISPSVNSLRAGLPVFEDDLPSAFWKVLGAPRDIRARVVRILYHHTSLLSSQIAQLWSLELLRPVLSCPLVMPPNWNSVPEILTLSPSFRLIAAPPRAPAPPHTPTPFPLGGLAYGKRQELIRGGDQGAAVRRSPYFCTAGRPPGQSAGRERC